MKFGFHLHLISQITYKYIFMSIKPNSRSNIIHSFKCEANVPRDNGFQFGEYPRLSPVIHTYLYVPLKYSMVAFIKIVSGYIYQARTWVF